MHTAVKILKEARNATFERCEIHGAVENSGSNTRFTDSIIGKIPKNIREHPRITLVLGSIIAGAILLPVEDGYTSLKHILGSFFSP